jgi:versiconal hemiacetal acetate esterase
LAKLPNTYITSCGHDTLRDDARLMKAALDKAGVPVRYDEYEGYPHYFWSYPGPSLKAASEEYYSNLAKGVDFVLSKL